VYCSDQAHSSIEKGVILAGLGQEGLRKIPSDAEYRMRPDALREAISGDRAAGWLPVAVVATVGTTSTTSVDPVSAIAEICESAGVWLHIDAAYAGAAAMLPECAHILDGAGRADSLVLNPHKWLFAPFDLSAFFCRRMDVVRQAFALTPEYLRTPDAARNLMDTGVQLGRRFRSLKLWMILRYFGAAGVRERLRYHIGLAQQLAGWIDAHPDFERLAPSPFSVVCFRAKPGRREWTEEGLAKLNEAILKRVNDSGEVFISHTVLDGRFTLRVAIGNLQTTDRHVARAWELLQKALAAQSW
jgi:aromatic-L-amino-acid decarboxylase